MPTPPPLPVLERITAAMVVVVNGITIVNGYNYNLQGEREKRYGNSPADKKVVVKQGDPQPLPDPPAMMLAWSQPYYLDVNLQIPESQNETVFPSKVLNIICADIHTALLEDRTLGGLSWDIEIGASQEWLVQQGDFDGRTFVCNVKYYTLETDPTVVGNPN